MKGKRKLRDGEEVAVHDNGGIRKLCGCPRAKWPKCSHPWHFNYRWKGKDHRLSLNRLLGKTELSKSEAEREAEILRIAIRDGKFSVDTVTSRSDAQAATETLKSYGHQWLEMAAARLKASTLSFYEDNLNNHVFPAIGDVPLRGVNRTTVKQFIGDLRAKQLARNTLNGIVRTLSTVLSEAVEDGKLAANPAFRRGPSLEGPECS